MGFHVCAFLGLEHHGEWNYPVCALLMSTVGMCMELSCVCISSKDTGNIHRKSCAYFSSEYIGDMYESRLGSHHMWHYV